MNKELTQIAIRDLLVGGSILLSKDFEYLKVLEVSDVNDKQVRLRIEKRGRDPSKSRNSRHKKEVKIQ